MDRFLEEIDGKDCQKETKKRAEDQALARTATKRSAEDQAPARTATTKQRAEDLAQARNAAATSAEDRAQARNAAKSVEDQTQAPKATATDRMAAPSLPFSPTRAWHRSRSS